MSKMLLYDESRTLHFRESSDVRCGPLACSTLGFSDMSDSHESNPYTAPDCEVSLNAVDEKKIQPTIGWGMRILLAPLYSIFGAFAGAYVGSFGFVFLTFAFDILLTPPLLPLQNYGQFDFLVIFTSILLSGIGLTFGLVPLVRWKIYVVIYFIGFVLMILCIAVDQFVELNWREAPAAAIIVLVMLPPIIAVVADIGVEKSYSRTIEQSRNTH